MTLSPKFGLTLAALAALGLAAAHPAAAQTTVYNFQAGGATQGPTYVGTGALGQGGTTFNRVAWTHNGNLNQIGGTFGTVQDSHGNNAASTVIFSYTAEDFNPDSGTFLATDPGALLGSVGKTTNPVKNNTPAVPDDISFTGLAANSSFTAIFYAENGHFADGRQTSYTLTDAAFNPIGSAQIATANSNNAFTTNGGNTLTFTGTTDANGGIYATFTNLDTGGYQEGDFDGAQFAVGTPVLAPETSSSVSLGLMLGLVGLAVVARKRSVKA